MNENGLELCEGHKQEKSQSNFAKHNCDYCKLEAKVEGLQDSRNYLEPEKNKNNYPSLVMMQIPQHLYDSDKELNAMAMLAFIMDEVQNDISIEEQRRIAGWFDDRYGVIEGMGQ